MAEVAAAAAAAAAKEATKQLIENPEQAAKIPTKLISGSISGMTSLFEGAWDIKDRTRSLQLTFSNLLQQKVSFVEDYFGSGTWYKNWQPRMEWVSINQGTVCNKQGSIMTGVSGGIKLKILEGNNHPEIFVYLGFTNPYSGGYKFFGEISEEDKTAQYGNDNSNDNSPKDIYGCGYRLTVTQTDSDICQMAFVYQLSYDE